MSYDIAWARVNLKNVPHLVTPEIPGPKSLELHGRASKIMKGYSGQVKLFPVVFDKGYGCTLTDVDGNTYLDFSSGIYVTTLGHCHPKVTEAVQKAAGQLMNCHDFTTPIKLELLEKLTSVLPGDLSGIQLYDSGTTAVEAALRVCRAATGKHEFLSCYGDFHGKSGHAVSLARMNRTNGPTREAGFYMVPRPNPYRPLFKKSDGTIDTDAYIRFFDEFITEATTGQVAAIVLEPIQGWAGSILPPDDFFPKLRQWCDKRKYLLVADEVLTSMGRTGKYLAMEHWNTLPDVVTLGKGFGNGFPVTAMVVRKPYANAVENISASTSYGGNPMACAAALASIVAIEEEGLLENAKRLEDFFIPRMEKMKREHKIIGDVRCKGCLMGIELVKDRNTKEPFDEAGKQVYQRAFRKGLAWIPAGHILRMSPPIVMDVDVAAKCMDMIDEAIGETEKELGY
ncbi:MAG: aspartate aminotransferase family protein [Verrucomicrobia bacterium]|nr:aspartate aminotransferase family protein [Verrucomicrobiota bacterium]MBU1735412.1 aspartate aminotransferase family protein [Verrucomicrobiota bacterium]MBU1857433.1 aspartate aminotransferase family protein [Verrucomicrobiota bacterium]